jgi:hypothetical protein
MLYTRCKWKPLFQLSRILSLASKRHKVAAKMSFQVSVRPVWYCSGDNRKGIPGTIENWEKAANQLQLTDSLPDDSREG